MKVLVIEDEKMVAESIRAILESKGFEVETVYDGEAGTEYAELGIYDLLILDVMMPKLNGFQVARQVRADRCSTPILMLTARSDIEDRIQGLNAGADYYLTKPFDSRNCWPASTPCCGGRAIRWTSCGWETPRWTLPPVRWYAEKTASACPPGDLTSCAFYCRARAGCCPRR